MKQREIDEELHRETDPGGSEYLKRGIILYTSVFLRLLAYRWSERIVRITLTFSLICACIYMHMVASRSLFTRVIFFLSLLARLIFCVVRFLERAEWLIHEYCYSI